MNNYTPLHVHSDASSDGAGTIEALVKRAKEIGCKALACTDHGTLANAVSFWSACQDVEIKAILGMEAYLSYMGQRHHITLLSLNEEGFNNLVALDTLSHDSGFSGGYPTMTLGDIESRSDGLYALTGCASSALYRDKEEHALNYVMDIVDALSPYKVAIEAMFVGTHDLWTRPAFISTHTKLPLVITNDSHYPCERQFHAHQAITKARKGFTYDSRQLWLKSREEIQREGFKYWSPYDVDKALDNTVFIADSADNWSMKAPPTLPAIPNVKEILSKFLKEALKQDILLRGQKEVRMQRLQYEFSILSAKGFLDYIYILWDIVNHARYNDIRVGPARGSGAGSYVLFLLGITQVDPLEYGLLFERFINPTRVDYPDVDVDFEADRRSEVINYAHDRWGAMPIATYSTYSHKSAIHDIARTLAIPKTLEEEAADSAYDSPEFRRFIAANPDALETYNTMLGQIRHRGKHAAGIIITNRPVPIERAGDELVVAWAEGMNSRDLSKVGIVKYDLLGLTALSQLSFMAKKTGIEPVVTFNNPDVFDLFCKGDISGIFQWTGSDGIRELTMRISPRNFRDLATVNALYRPGALDAGLAEEYPELMKKPRLIHPRIDPILAPTCGVICYQEQVMAVVSEVMGTGLAEGETVRKLFSKAAHGDPKWEREVEDLRIRFYAEGKKNGFDEDTVLDLWDEVKTHSRYSFNLSHATAYTMVSYQMAWYKVYHRDVFTLAMLQYDKSNAQTYMMDAVESDLAISMPSINYSSDTYELNSGTIYIPLSDVGFLGEEAVKCIIEERKVNGPFLGYADFDKRIPKRKCNSRARAMLERVGAFKDFKDDPVLAMPKYSEIPVSGVYQTQLEVLNYIVPTKKLMNRIAELRKRPTKPGFERFAGFVREAKEKVSAKGAYKVYYLSPFGHFWCRGIKAAEKIEVGHFVTGTKSEYGNSSDVKAYVFTGASS